jgi:hypothetical protein
MARVRALLATVKQAVGEAYGSRTFLRGFNDAGDAVGAEAEEGRWYLTAQTWPLLAGCGSLSQRTRVLDLLLEEAGQGPIPTLSRPYQAPPPPWLCASLDIPGTGANGGVQAEAWACALWAMAEAGAREAALKHWPAGTLRQLMAAHDLPPFLPASAGGTLPSRLLAAEWRYPAFLGKDGTPDAEWLGWQHFALCKILTQE